MFVCVCMCTFDGVVGILFKGVGFDCICFLLFCNSIIFVHWFPAKLIQLTLFVILKHV